MYHQTFNIQQGLKKLTPDDLPEFLDQHAKVRLANDREYMKPLNPDLLTYVVDKGMPVIGFYIDGKLVSGCVVFYPSDESVANVLEGYNFAGREQTTAVISALWTDPDYAGKGLSKKVIDAAMSMAFIDKRTVFESKVWSGNVPSEKCFGHFSYVPVPNSDEPHKNNWCLAL